MDYINSMILEEFDRERELYLRLEEQVAQSMEKMLVQQGIKVMAVTHRVKDRDSLAGKLQKKDGKYHHLKDITDVLGFRIISCFADDVDRICAAVEKSFRVDWKNSVDKRGKLSPTVFGYLSVHYVCSLPESDAYPKELQRLKFEIQIRSILQHVWAEIEHDLGYKSEFTIPKRIRRDFSRVAGLLEIADEKFVAIRNSLDSYGDEVREKIQNDNAADISIDLISLKEYMRNNRTMREFLNELSALCHAEVEDISPEAYPKQLSWFGMEMLGDISEMIEQNRELALSLVREELVPLELDIVSSNAALRYLCQAKLINGKYPEEKIQQFMELSITDKKRAAKQAKRLYRRISAQ